MGEFPISREDLEDIMGCHVYEFQWIRLKEHFDSQRKTIRVSKEDLFTNRPDLVDVIKDEMNQNYLNSLRKSEWVQATKALVRGHNHTELGRRGDCPGCQDQIPDQINPCSPNGCSYTFEENFIDSDWVCNRHGFFAPGTTIVNGSSTTPCRARQ